MTNDRGIDTKPLNWTEGFFLEVQDNKGALCTPLWVSIRKDKVVFTKQIHMATVFRDHSSATETMGQLHLEPEKLNPSYILVPTVRSYNRELHEAFWKNYESGVTISGEVRQDYSLHLLKARKCASDLEDALLNGPQETVKPLLKALVNETLDLMVAVEVYLESR